MHPTHEVSCHHLPVPFGYEVFMESHKKKKPNEWETRKMRKYGSKSKHHGNLSKKSETQTRMSQQSSSNQFYLNNV